MLVLFGDTNSTRIIELLARLKWGRMFASRRPRPFKGERWGFDNGAFDAWRRGVSFDVDLFLRRLEIAQAIGIPTVSIVPDIVAGGRKSLDFSWEWFQKMPDNWPLTSPFRTG